MPMAENRRLADDETDHLTDDGDGLGPIGKKDDKDAFRDHP